MNMDFEQLLKQEVQKAARQDYEEITAKAQDLSLIHISEPTRPYAISRMPSSA